MLHQLTKPNPILCGFHNMYNSSEKKISLNLAVAFKLVNGLILFRDFFVEIDLD